MELRQQFLEKAEKYFDASVTDNEEVKKRIAVDMALLIRRERALYLAKRQPKQIDPKPVEAETQPLVVETNIWCGNHPKSNWGINPKTGSYYARCSDGFKTGEECKFRTD